MLLATVSIDNLEVCTPGVSPTSIFHPAGPAATHLNDVIWLVVGVTAAIGVVVLTLLGVAIVKGRRPAGLSPGAEPTQVFGSNQVELAWTVVPTVIVFLLTLVTVRVIRDVDLTEMPDGALRVQVIGHQWWWEYRYPELGIVTANELVVPVGRKIWLELESADVSHSWWVPRLAGKRDVIPNYQTNTWFQADATGTYLGQCAEYCGTAHAGMLLRVDAIDAAAFEAWSTAQRSTAADPSSAVAMRGRAVFESLACASCHTVSGVSDGLFGPDLSHVASRATLGSGAIDFSEDNVRRWIDNPQAIKPGCNMPSLGLTPDELTAVVAYLMGLR
ncbi:MAG: cytochrome c oxidase subunit II [Planctomycetota bacterium]|nr:cytochrome c oxidase subunit II [Planctomycetota bacterium]